MPIDYFREREPLGTVGALALIDGLDDAFLVMNGDVLTDMDYAALLEHHVASGAAATIAVDAPAREHLARRDGVRRRRRARARHGLRREADAVLRGLDGRLLLRTRGCSSTSRPDARLDFPDLILRLLAAGERVEAWRPDAYWLDLGRHDDYEQAIAEFEEMRHAPAARISA